VNRIAPLALLAAGIILLMMGWDAYRSVSSGVSRLFTGAPTDKALWLLIGGALLAAAGLGGLSRGSK